MSANTTRLPARPVLASTLVTRVGTGAVLAAAVLAALFLLSTAAWGAVVLLVVAVGADEWAKLARLDSVGRPVFVVSTLVAGAAILWFGAEHGWPSMVVVGCGVATLFWLVVGVPAVVMGRLPAPSLALALCGAIALLGALIAIVSMHARSPWLVLAAMAVVWIADTAAYFAGRRFGRRKLAPAISPGKTWEGAYGGIAAVVIYALALWPTATRDGFVLSSGARGLLLWVAFAVALAILSIVGDLFESLLKRGAGVKDSGALLPGHGGVLDRVDALLAAMPPLALAATVMLARA